MSRRDAEQIAPLESESEEASEDPVHDQALPSEESHPPDAQEVAEATGDDTPTTATVQIQLDPRELAEQHTHLIRKVIGQIGMRLPPYVQREDLVGVAALGLLDAAKKFDASRGKRFASYAEYRIRGAILDELRHRDPMPRVLRGKVKRLERTIDELTRGLGRPPEDDEVAGAMGMRLAKYHEMRLLVEHAQTVAFNETLSQTYATPGGSQGRDLLDTSARAHNPLRPAPEAESGEFQPLRELMGRERVTMLAAAITDLDTRDQLILSLHYQEDLNFRQIGEILGLTESRISQLHKGALMALKDKLERIGQD